MCTTSRQNVTFFAVSFQWEEEISRNQPTYRPNVCRSATVTATTAKNQSVCQFYRQQCRCTDLHTITPLNTPSFLRRLSWLWALCTNKKWRLVLVAEEVVDKLFASLSKRIERSSGELIYLPVCQVGTECKMCIWSRSRVLVAKIEGGRDSDLVVHCLAAAAAD